MCNHRDRGRARASRFSKATRGSNIKQQRAGSSPARHAASLATSASNRERRQSKVHRAMEWPKPSSVRSSVTTFTSVRAPFSGGSIASAGLGKAFKVAGAGFTLCQGAASKITVSCEWRGPDKGLEDRR